MTMSAAGAAITLTIDSKLVSAHAGQTLLEVIREQGGRVPTLCNFDGLSAWGGCRLCIVEIAGRPRPVAACAAMAEEGLQVETSTERLQKYRRSILELLLAERNHVCSVCVMNGNCELQDLSAAHGIDHVRYDYQYPDCEVDATHDRFVVDHNRCVLCTRCVRVCDEVEGAHTWDLDGRGVNARVITDLAQPWGEAITCTSCGKCMEVCPTGALFEKGATVAEMVKDKQKLRFLNNARNEHRWDVGTLDQSRRNGGANP
jgi:bidirectional [NiFe] hydrogenase diaphorase subunit